MIISYFSQKLGGSLFNCVHFLNTVWCKWSEGKSMFWHLELKSGQNTTKDVSRTYRPAIHWTKIERKKTVLLETLDLIIKFSLLPLYFSGRLSVFNFHPCQNSEKRSPLQPPKLKWVIFLEACEVWGGGTFHFQLEMECFGKYREQKMERILVELDDNKLLSWILCI